MFPTTTTTQPPPPLGRPKKADTYFCTIKSHHCQNIALYMKMLPERIASKKNETRHGILNPSSSYSFSSSCHWVAAGAILISWRQPQHRPPCYGPPCPLPRPPTCPQLFVKCSAAWSTLSSLGHTCYLPVSALQATPLVKFSYFFAAADIISWFLQNCSVSINNVPT